MRKYYQNEPKSNGFYSKNHLSKIKDRAFVVHLDEFRLIAPHWTTFYVKVINATYFGRFGFELISKEIKNS